MAREDQDDIGGPSRKPKDENNDPGKTGHESGASAQSQSQSIGDEERSNREGAGEGRRSGSQSNAS